MRPMTSFFRRKLFACSCGRVLWLAYLAAVLLVPALAQSGDTGKSSPDTTKGHWGPGDRLPDKWEIGIFGGASFFDEIKEGLGTKLHDGGAFGVSATQNFWDHVGIRESFTYRVNNLTFLTPNQPGLPNYGFGQRVYHWEGGPMTFFTKRGG